MLIRDLGKKMRTKAQTTCPYSFFLNHSISIQNAMSSAIKNLGLSPRFHKNEVSRMNMRRVPRSSKVELFQRQKPVEDHTKLGSWRQRRNIITRKIGSLEDANSRMNCKFKNNGQEGRLDEEYESGGNEEDKLMAFNRAFQDAILATMDREISSYEE